MRKSVLVSVWIVFACCTGAYGQRSDDTRATMDALYEALTSVYITSLHPDEFQDPARREDILLSLRMLSANATRLEQHSTLDEGSDYLRGSLARDCRAAAQRFERDEYAGTRFILNKLVENCVACHSKLPASRRFDMGRSFVDDADIEGLTDEELLKLEMATRQFEAATETCERMLLSPEAVADQLVALGVFEDYFKLTLRVTRKPERAITTLQTFAQRRDVPGYLVNLIDSWIAALKDAESYRGKTGDLERAQLLIGKAKSMQRFPADRRGLVLFVDASGHLYEYLASKPTDKRRLSEAYYLLGLAESHISHGYWVSETDFYLERAVRLAPDSESAREAYDLLEAYTTAAFSGSAGLQVPDDVAAKLRELKSLIE